MKNSIVACIVLAVTFSGCEDSGVAPKPLELSIVPLALGNSWTYADTLYDSLGAVQSTASDFYFVRTDTLLFGRRFFSYIGYCANTDSGLIQYNGFAVTVPTGDTIYQIILLYRYPARQGDNSGFSTVGTTDTVIEVPAGSFHCIKYLSYDLGFLYSVHFVSPGVGVIKVIYYSRYFLSGEPEPIRDMIQLRQFSLK